MKKSPATTEKGHAIVADDRTRQLLEQTLAPLVERIEALERELATLKEK